MYDDVAELVVDAVHRDLVDVRRDQGAADGIEAVVVRDDGNGLVPGPVRWARAGRRPRRWQVGILSRSKRLVGGHVFARAVAHRRDALRPGDQLGKLVNVFAVIGNLRRNDRVSSSARRRD